MKSDHRREVTGSNPVEALIFSGFFFPMFKWKIYCDDHSSLCNSYICTAVVDQMKNDRRSKFSNLSNWKEEA